MTKANIETQYTAQVQAEQQSQNVAIQIACISFFPMLFIIGKVVIAFIG